MKYLEAKRLAGGIPELPSRAPAPENKMQPGTRSDQTSTPIPRSAVLTLASRLGVEFSTITGTGDGGEVTEKDVRAAAKARKDTLQTQPIPDTISGIAKEPHRG